MNLNVTLTKVGQDMGDHAQDVCVALDVTPEITLEELTKNLRGPNDMSWVVNQNWYITVRVAYPISEVLL